jgi:uncharacterized protein
MKFLTAKWEHLLLANYPVDPKVLEPYVPTGTRLDPFQDVVYVSLVAFLFNRTRVLGIPIPGHTRFEEVNLRFYVVPTQEPERRAVTFLREIVPLSLIPWIANTLFHENYIALPMSHAHSRDTLKYAWQTPIKQKPAASTSKLAPSRADSHEHVVSADMNQPLALPPKGSLAEFITEHYWGYAKAPFGTLEYQVTHPQWTCCEVSRYTIDIDFASSFGQPFAFLNGQSPSSVLYAAGSAVSVGFPKRNSW